jgi:hypothetical protein
LTLLFNLALEYAKGRIGIKWSKSAPGLCWCEYIRWKHKYQKEKHRRSI